MTAATIFAGVIGVSGSASAAHCNDYPPEAVFLYCGEHIARPLTFKVNPSGSGVSSGLVQGVTRDAIAQWKLFWPLAVNSSECLPLCYGGTTTTGFGEDGKSTILWGDPGRCGGGHSGGIGVACLWYEGSQGAPRHRIKEVDIILNKNVEWKQATGADLAIGEAEGTTAGLVPSDGWYDVQSTLTHELGHALGLEDIGNLADRFAYDLTDAPKYSQTMYRWYYPRSTDKRTLNYGDVAGLQLAALDFRKDKL